MTTTRATAAPDARNAPCLGEGSQNSQRPFLGPLAKRTAWVRMAYPSSSAEVTEARVVPVSVAAEPWGQT